MPQVPEGVSRGIQGQASTCGGRSRPSPERAKQGSYQKPTCWGISGKSMMSSAGGMEVPVLPGDQDPESGSAAKARQDPQGRQTKRPVLASQSSGCGSRQGSGWRCARRRICGTTCRGAERTRREGLQRPAKPRRSKQEQGWTTGRDFWSPAEEAGAGVVGPSSSGRCGGGPGERGAG